MLHPRQALRRGRTRGAAAVEAAIVLPLVLLIFVGIIEFGLYFKDALAASASVRAGARTASVVATNATGGTTFAAAAANQASYSIDTVNFSGSPMLYVYDPSTTPNPYAACGTHCISFTWDAATKKFASPSGTWNPCGAADSPVQFGVALSAEHRAVTGMIFRTLAIHESAVLAFEQAPTC